MMKELTESNVPSDMCAGCHVRHDALLLRKPGISDLLSAELDDSSGFHVSGWMEAHLIIHTHWLLPRQPTVIWLHRLTVQQESLLPAALTH